MKDYILFSPETTSSSSSSPLEQVTPPDEKLIKLLKEIRSKHPNDGAVKISEAVRKKKPKWNVNDRRVRRLLFMNGLALNSEKQAQEDETNPSFQLVKMELKLHPTDVFELLEQRGKGSFGVVYKAIHKRSGQVVAIKRVPFDGDIAEIMKEIEFMKTCENDHIVRFYGHFVADKMLWIVMEYCGAGSVSDILQLTNNVLNEHQIAKICHDSLVGLSYLHRRNKIHRDIKGGNIVLNSKGQAKLVDFGVSSEISENHMKRNTVIGSPYWIAPEVLTEIGYDTKADIWSLGITCFEMAEGNPPLYGMKPMLAMMSIPTKPPPTLPADKNYSDEFRDFIAKCLVKDPKERASAEELLEHPFIKAGRKPLHLQPVILNVLDKIARGYLDKLQNSEHEFHEPTFKDVLENDIILSSPPSRLAAAAFSDDTMVIRPQDPVNGSDTYVVRS